MSQEPVFAAPTAISGAALVQIELDLLHSVGGQLAEDNGDGIIDHAEPSEIYVIGGASGVPSGTRDYQASYEFSLRDPSLSGRRKPPRSDSSRSPRT